MVWVRNRELAAIYVSGQKSGEGCPELVVVCVSGQKSGVGCSIRFMSKIRRSLKYSFYVRNRDAAAAYVSNQKFGVI